MTNENDRSELYKIYCRKDGRRVVRVLKSDLRDLLERNAALGDLGPLKRILPGGTLRPYNTSEHCNSGDVGEVVDTLDRIYDHLDKFEKSIEIAEAIHIRDPLRLIK